MQFKNFGKFINLVNEFNSCSNITDNVINKLINSLANMTGAEILTATSVIQMTDAQKLELIQLCATDAQNYKNISSINTMSLSQKDATFSTLGLGTAIKGLGAKIKELGATTWAFLSTNPVGWILSAIAAIGGAVFAVTKIHDFFTVSLEEQKEKLLEAKNAYKNATSELEDLKSEIQNIDVAIKELENTHNLSWVEQEELQRLREVTTELELQKGLKEDIAKQAANDLYIENQATFNKEFTGSNSNVSVEDLKQQLSSGIISIIQLDLNKPIDALAALQYLEEEKNKLTDTDEIARYDAEITYLQEGILEDAQDNLLALSSYKQNMLEIAGYRELTDAEQSFYDNLESTQKLLYEVYSPATWNSIEFDTILNTDGIEKTKEELIAMAQAGTLTTDTLQSYTNLNNTIENSGLILEEGESAASAFVNEIYALADEYDALELASPQLPDYSTLADTADQTATAADSLHSAISTLNNAFAEQVEHGSISTDTMLKLAEAGYATALSFDEETGACTINTHAMQELAKAKIQNQIADLQSLKTDIASKLQNEGIIASASAQGFIDLAKAKTVAAAANGLTAEQSSAIDDFNNAEAEILALQNMLQNFDQVEAGQYSSSFSSSASKSETDYKSLLDRETSLLEKQLDANLITFSDYLDKRKSLLDDYYTLGKITAEEYYDGLSALYESQLSTYDKVVGAVTNRIDKEINSLEKQKEVIEESYRFKMDAVQAEIDALNKENETRKEQIALEQAQYEAERARNQRSVKQFVNGQFVYTADMNEVKAAEENLAEQEQQMKISLLEDQIASLEQEMENTTASLDNQISALEAYKEQWSEISSVYEEQQNALIAAEILGADWEAQVLSGRLATLQAFTNQYIALQQAQANAAAQAAQTPTPPANHSNTGGQTTLAYYAMTRTGKTVTATPFSSSAEAWNWLVNTYGSLDAHQNYKVVQKYADGGVIGAQPGLLDFIAQAVNEDHLIAARQGERILTASQNKQFEALVKLAPELLSMHHPLQNLSVPDSFRSLFTPASTPNITIGDIHLHNVNDVNSLSRAIIQRLPGQMMQAIHRH